MNFKWIGPLALLAALVIGDQIRINRPGHKYRLTVEVETPEGVKSASGVLAVTPDRGYSRRGNTSASGDAVFVDLGGGKNLVPCWRMSTHRLDLDAINYVALRAYNAAGGKRVNFNDMSRMTGVVPVKGELIPVLVTFADPANPATARAVSPDDSRRCWARVSPARHHRRGGAERLLADRFRRPAGRTRDARQSWQNCPGSISPMHLPPPRRRCRPRACRRRDDRRQGSFFAEISARTALRGGGWQPWAALSCRAVTCRRRA